MMRFQEILSSPVLKTTKTTQQFMAQGNEMAAFFAQLLGSGDYLWEDFIRANSEETIKMLTHASKNETTDIGIHPSQYEEACKAVCDSEKSFEEKIHALNAFKDTQSYHIDIDILLRYEKSFKELSYRLSELARTIIRNAITIIYEELTTVHGYPRTAAGLLANWVLCGLGKFGGSALGYASDIEIMLIYDDAGYTDGDAEISNREFF